MFRGGLGRQFINVQQSMSAVPGSSLYGVKIHYHILRPLPKMTIIQQKALKQYSVEPLSAMLEGYWQC